MSRTPDELCGRAAPSARGDEILQQIDSVANAVTEASRAQDGLALIVRAALATAERSRAVAMADTTVSDVALDIALGTADAVLRNDEAAVDASMALVAALPLGGEAETAMRGLVEAAVALLKAAESGDYAAAGAIYKARVGAVGDAFCTPPVSQRPPRAERFISVA